MNYLEHIRKLTRAHCEKRAQAELARASKIDVSALHRFRTGERDLRPPDLVALVDALGFEIRVVRVGKAKPTAAKRATTGRKAGG